MPRNFLRWRRLGLLLLALALWPAVAQAVPAQLNVQGVLFDETGAAVEGATSITVRVYDGAEGDAALIWEPAAPLDVLCETGVFNALVPAAAEGAEAEAFTAAFAGGEPRWLGIAPEGAAELSPRIPVVSVAYALVAAKAAVADVADVARGVDCAGCVPATALDPAVQTTFLAYDNAVSGLDATTYQAAIDELAGLVDALTTSLATLQARVDGLAAVATSGAYGDLTGTPDLSGYAQTSDLAVVATSGAYGDLSGVPDVCAEALDCPAVLELQSRLDAAEAGLVDAEARLHGAEAAFADADARLWCLENCDAQRLGDCRARDCDGTTRTCTDAGALPDGAACGGGNGRCIAGECHGAFCGGVSCPYLRDYRIACNAQAHCEYAPVDSAFWRQWDVWTWVPAGSFQMGSPASEAGSEEHERPVHEVTFANGFLFMKYEIVVAQYLACEAAGRCPTPSTADWNGDGWGLNRATNGRQNHPQNGLTWQQARDFCAWVAPGGRLPSEAEWEYAASGPVHRRYPWGDSPEPTCAHAVFNHDQSGGQPWGCLPCTEPGCSGTLPVGERPAGASWIGALDLSGNLWEWCEDWYQDSYAGAPVDGSAWVTPAGTHRILRGGGYTHEAPALRTALRACDEPTYRSANFGARCVRPLAQ